MSSQQRPPLVFYLLLAWFAYTVFLTVAVFVFLQILGLTHSAELTLSNFVDGFMELAIGTAPGVSVFGLTQMLLASRLIRLSSSLRAIVNWILFVALCGVSNLTVSFVKGAQSEIVPAVGMLVVAGLLMLLLPGIRRKLFLMKSPN